MITTTQPEQLIQLVVLDIAGTTVDEGLQVYKSLEQTVVAHGGTPSAADIDRWHGANKHEALRALLTTDDRVLPNDALLEAAFADFKRRLKSAYVAHPPRPLPGIVDAIAILKASGIKVALNTGFDRDILDTLLPAVGWDDYSVVDTVVGGSDVPLGRPAPYMIFKAMERLRVTDVARVLVAGDTPRDLEAATNAGAAYVVGVLSGAGTADELGRSRHTHLLPSVASIPALLGVSSLPGVTS